MIHLTRYFIKWTYIHEKGRKLIEQRVESIINPFMKEAVII